MDSLQACLYVYEQYLEKTNNKYLAIKKYKGINSKSNNWIIDKVINIEAKIK